MPWTIHIACSQTFLSESGSDRGTFYSSETSPAGGILQYCLWCSQHGILCSFFKFTFSRPCPCAHQLRDNSLSFPATLNCYKVDEGFRLLPPNTDYFLHVTFLAFWGLPDVSNNLSS